jgi:hypothetical protein
MIFGGASLLASTLAPSIAVPNALRFVMAVGAEIVVGSGTMTEFVPPHARGRRMAFMAFVVVSRAAGHGRTRRRDPAELRLAVIVRNRRHRRADRLVSALPVCGSPAAEIGADSGLAPKS